MSEILGVEYSQAILDRVKARMMEQGVRYEGLSLKTGAHMFRGMANNKYASLHIQSLNEKPNEATENALVEEYLEDITSQLRRYQPPKQEEVNG